MPKRPSPLLRSAIEVLDHGLWHLLRSDTALDMKFAVMHVDQAVELLLKERVRTGRKSIYKRGGKETISIWAAYDLLEEIGCQIPEKADLEILHEERNGIQHKHSNPDPDTAFFLIETALEFIDRFLRDEMELELSDFVSVAHLEEFDLP